MKHFLVAFITLVATTASFAGTNKTLNCNFSARPSVVSGEDTDFRRANISIPISQNGRSWEIQTVSVLDYEVKVAVMVDRFDDDGIKIWLGTLDAEGNKFDSHATLFQAPYPEAPEGSHGFTGLNYVYNPHSTSELQYWCVIAE